MPLGVVTLTESDQFVKVLFGLGLPLFLMMYGASEPNFHASTCKQPC